MKNEIIKGGAIVFSVIKSFFLAVTGVAWGLVSIFGFNALLSFLIVKTDSSFDLSKINPLFLKLEIFISNNLMLFIFAFFALYLYFDIKEILK